VDGTKLRELGWEARSDLMEPSNLRKLLRAYRGAAVQLAPYVEAEQ
jgi:hypothetical protein